MRFSLNVFSFLVLDRVGNGYEQPSSFFSVYFNLYLPEFFFIAEAHTTETRTNTLLVGTRIGVQI